MKNFITTTDVVFIAVAILAWFIVIIGSYIYEFKEIKSQDVLICVKSGILEEDKDFKVYEFDGNMYAIDKKHNIIYKVDTTNDNAISKEELERKMNNDEPE
jgi:hypothetical protein